MYIIYLYANEKGNLFKLYVQVHLCVLEARRKEAF